MPAGPPYLPSLRSSFAAALSSLYRPVKVVPARPGRRCSTALVTPVTSDGHSESAGRLTGRHAQRSNDYQPTTNFHDVYPGIQEFEAEFQKKLEGSEDTAAIVRWVSAKVLESYRNGITAGQKGAKVIRQGESRPRGLPGKAA
jgi:hypothetical protein